MNTSRANKIYTKVYMEVLHRHITGTRVQLDTLLTSSTLGHTCHTNNDLTFVIIAHTNLIIWG